MMVWNVLIQADTLTSSPQRMKGPHRYGVTFSLLVIALMLSMTPGPANAAIVGLRHQNPVSKTADVTTPLKPLEAPTVDQVMHRMKSEPVVTTDLFEQVQTAIDEQEYLKALASLRQLEAQYPNSPTIQEWLAVVHTQLQDYGQALIHYRRVLAIEPQRPMIWYALGEVWQGMEQPDEAITAYQKAIELWPKNPMFYTALADAYRQTQQWEAAKLQFETAIQLDQDYAAAYLGLGRLYEDQQHPDQAMSYYQLFIEKAPPTDAQLSQTIERLEVLKHQQLTTPTKP